MTENKNTIIWSKSNAGELFPFVATPMTFSVSKKFIGALISPFVRNFGIDIEKSRPFGLVAGRIYINMNCAAALIKRATFSMKKNFSELFGGDCDGLENALEILKHSSDGGVEFSHLKFISRLPYVIYHFIYKNLSAKRYEIERELIESIDKYRCADFKNHSNAALLSAIDDLAILLERSTEKVWPVVLWAMIASSLVFSFFGIERANIMLSASNGTDSAEPGRALLKLALNAQNSGLSEFLLKCRNFGALESFLKTTGAGRVFLYNFKRFMLIHGHHALGEVDVACPRWSEAPDYILSIVKSYLARGDIKEITLRYEGLYAKNVSKASDVWNVSKLKPLKPLLGVIIGAAKRGLEFRENYKNRLVMMIDIVRKILLESARRLFTDDIIKTESDIFFIDLDELKKIMNKSDKFYNIGAAINIRKIEYENCRKVNPPSFVIGEFDMAAALKDIENIKDAGADKYPSSKCVVFKGIAVSAGTVTGVARVIESAETVENVMRGEILVAPFTDPGWTPYFVNAAGLVTELGGPLSHGSIIAREYGIPAVVNVKNITGLIKTGQLVKVDGNNGTVSVV